MDPTITWILSRVGPTIRRDHRLVLVSYCTTVVVCIARLLVAVSLKIMQPLLCCVCVIKKVNTAIPVYDNKSE